MNYKTSFIVLWIGFLVGFIAGFFSIPTGVVLIAIAIIQAIIFYRCPNCKYSLLETRSRTTYYCPHCGEELW